jgi:hypothetical protein
MYNVHYSAITTPWERTGAARRARRNTTRRRRTLGPGYSLHSSTNLSTGANPSSTSASASVLTRPSRESKDARQVEALERFITFAWTHAATQSLSSRKSRFAFPQEYSIPFLATSGCAFGVMTSR